MRGSAPSVNTFRKNISLAFAPICAYGSPMNPTTAIDKLLESGWTYATLSPYVCTHRANLLRIHKKGQEATYRVGVALIEMANRGKKPPARKK